MMSSSHETEYRCPYCGKPFSITVYDSVSVKTDPDIRERCISGDIFRHSCPHCHTDFMIQADLLYLDSDRKFVIYLSSEPANETLNALGRPLREKGYTLRRTETLAEFTEKIQIFEDGISDITVELAKYDSFIEFIDNRNGRAEEVTSVEYQNCNDGVIKINVRTDDKGLSFLIPSAMLDEEIRAEADRFDISDEVFPVINGDWLIDLFREDGNPAA